MIVLALSAHPDDETLGCGGTILRHVAEGGQVSWLIATRACGPDWETAVVERKNAEVSQVAEAYGMKGVFRLDFPTGRLDTVPLDQLIRGIQGAVSDVTPESIYLVHSGDVHTDHRAVFQAAASPLKPFYARQWRVRRILAYETLSSTDAATPEAFQRFIPNVYVEVSKYLDRKIEIMGLYETEVREDPLPRGPSSIRAAACHRGATVGLEYAEAFSLVREVS